MATKLATVGQIIDQSDERRGLNIAQRIAAVMGDVDYIQKEKKAGMQYTIVSHDAVTAKVRPLLHKHGVVYYPRDLHVSQDGNRTQARFTVRFENIDDRSDHIDVETFGYGVDSQDKGPGKAMSYGVKYALLKVLGLETGDDPDTDQSAKADHRPSPATDDQLITIRVLLPSAGVTEDVIKGGYKVSSLVDLTEDDARKVIKRLEAKIKENRS
jgi:hypothetical protein